MNDEILNGISYTSLITHIDIWAGSANVSDAPVPIDNTKLGRFRCKFIDETIACDTFTASFITNTVERKVLRGKESKVYVNLQEMYLVTPAYCNVIFQAFVAGTEISLIDNRYLEIDLDG